MTGDDSGDDTSDQARLEIGHDVIVIKNRYEALSILNDVLIGVFFTVGSVLFYFSSLEPVAITLFLLGSIDFLLRPVIRLSRRIHLKRIGQDPGYSSYDY